MEMEGQRTASLLWKWAAEVQFSSGQRCVHALAMVCACPSVSKYNNWCFQGAIFNNPHSITLHETSGLLIVANREVDLT